MSCGSRSPLLTSIGPRRLLGDGADPRHADPRSTARDHAARDGAPRRLRTSRQDRRRYARTGTRRPPLAGCSYPPGIRAGARSGAGAGCSPCDATPARPIAPPRAMGAAGLRGRGRADPPPSRSRAQPSVPCHVVRPRGIPSRPDALRSGRPEPHPAGVRAALAGAARRCDRAVLASAADLAAAAGATAPPIKVVPTCTTSVCCWSARRRMCRFRRLGRTARGFIEVYLHAIRPARHRCR